MFFSSSTWEWYQITITILNYRETTYSVYCKHLRIFLSIIFVFSFFQKLIHIHVVIDFLKSINLSKIWSVVQVVYESKWWRKPLFLYYKHIQKANKAKSCECGHLRDTTLIFQEAQNVQTIYYLSVLISLLEFRKKILKLLLNSPS